MTIGCMGTAPDHCCYLGEGGVCPYVEERTVPGRRWACGLMRKLGDWNLVMATPEYRENVAPWLEPLGINCRDWPQDHPGARCSTCGWGINDGD
jgi:hypothetical protein